jgi:hypothetical protein
LLRIIVEEVLAAQPHAEDPDQRERDLDERGERVRGHHPTELKLVLAPAVQRKDQ